MKIITAGIPNTLQKVFFMRRLGFPLKGRASPSCTKFSTSLFCWMSSTTKIESLPFLNVSHRPFPNRRPHIGKRIYLVAIRQILPTILLTGHIFSFAIMTHLKILNCLTQNSVQQDYFPELSQFYHPSYQKCRTSFILALLSIPGVDCPTPYPKIFWENQKIGENLTQ